MAEPSIPSSVNPPNFATLLDRYRIAVVNAHIEPASLTRNIAAERAREALFEYVGMFENSRSQGEEASARRTMFMHFGVADTNGSIYCRKCAKRDGALFDGGCLISDGSIDADGRPEAPLQDQLAATKEALALNVTWEALAEHGRASGARLVNGIAWSFDFHGMPVTHESDTRYLITTSRGVVNVDKLSSPAVPTEISGKRDAATLLGEIADAYLLWVDSAEAPDFDAIGDNLGRLCSAIEDGARWSMVHEAERLASSLGASPAVGVETDEIAWLIERAMRNGMPEYWAGGSFFSTDSGMAIRFARRADAEKCITRDQHLAEQPGEWRAVEHMWCGPAPAILRSYVSERSTRDGDRWCCAECEYATTDRTAFVVHYATEHPERNREVAESVTDRSPAVPEKDNNG